MDCTRSGGGGLWEGKCWDFVHIGRNSATTETPSLEEGLIHDWVGPGQSRALDSLGRALEALKGEDALVEAAQVEARQSGGASRVPLGTDIVLWGQKMSFPHYVP